ncbi:MAG: hypothetical protein HYT80_07640 [Euryarchaeota archaeon]|nr:hypothetical protein [Euryarchaeota archaeon]
MRPRRFVNGLFAAFAGAMGLAYVFANLSPDYLGWVGAWAIGVYIGLAVVAAACLVWVAREFPNEVVGATRRSFLVPSFVSGGAFVAQMVVLYLFVERHGALPFSGLPPSWFVPGMISFLGLLGAFLYLLLVLAQRVPLLHGDAGARARKQVALVSLALLPYVALASAGHALGTFQGEHRLGAAAYGALVLVCLVPGLLWFRNAERARGDERPLFLTLAVACFALPLAGTGFVLLTPDWNKVGVLGLSRFAGVAVLAYAVLRQGLFDLQVRLKWTISRGTLAGLFVAMFFIVSELVQDYVGKVVGAAAGIAAAGGLALVLAPLHRMTERVADAALPRVRPDDPAYLLGQKRETYREALFVAWSDGQITAKEMRMLYRLREALGLPDEEIARLEHEVAVGSGPDPSPPGRRAKATTP